MSNVAETSTFAEEPFTIAIPDEKLADLQKRLELVTFPDELEEAGWEYGVPLADVKRLVARWRDGFDWRKSEARLNVELPQFTRDVEVDDHGALNVHYVHKRSDLESAIPLLFVHGWPGGFFEVRKILPLLTQTSNGDYPSFHVVSIGLPGFVFSQAPKKKGFKLDQYAEVCHKVMLALGYNEYVTQGGDWGSIITRRIALKYGGKFSKAWHTNFPFGIRPTLSQPLYYLMDRLTPLTEFEKAGAERARWFARKGSGYFHEQSTQPQTIGYSLADSPVGLLAWIYEKLVNWTDGYAWSDDEVLEWISMYWFSRSGPAASVRIYFEVMNANDAALGPDFTLTKAAAGARVPAIPAGVSRFSGEVVTFPIVWIRNAANVKCDFQHERGGHFPAHEVPEDLVGDLRKMFGRGGPVFGVVEGKTGYA